MCKAQVRKLLPVTWTLRPETHKGLGYSGFVQSDVLIRLNRIGRSVRDQANLSLLQGKGLSHGFNIGSRLFTRVGEDHIFRHHGRHHFGKDGMMTHRSAAARTLWPASRKSTPVSADFERAGGFQPGHLRS